MLKKLTLHSAALVALSSPSFAAVIANWNFQSPNPADATNFAVYPNPIPATVGTGNAGGTHVSAGADWTTPVGNGSTDSFSVNEWAVGDYFQFAVNTAGFSPIYVSFSQTSSGTGPRDFRLDYSSDGGTTFTPGPAYSVPANAAPNAWSSVLPVPAAFFSFDLSGVPTLSNNANDIFRLVDTSTISANGGAVAVGGTDRVDDFTVSDSPIAPPIPEPSSMFALVSGAALLAARRRRIG